MILLHALTSQFLAKILAVDLQRLEIFMSDLSLYIHVPWCIRKCPYCDFNSHKSPGNLPEQQYIDCLIQDLDEDLILFPHVTTLSSIFIGGGTPSLFSAEAYEKLFSEIQKRLTWQPDIEITLEANPGTIEQNRFYTYRQAGINRLSLGIQSFHPDQLQALGRIHNHRQAHAAIETARQAGFDNINLDLMYGLPKQSLHEGIKDLSTAISYQPEHISWYQLTIEPNTVFYKKTPSLPAEDTISRLEEAGLATLKQAGYQRYEISAFARGNHAAKHNLNYWLFGDYLGIGAGAHGKCSRQDKSVRTRKQRQPQDYLNSDKPFLIEEKPLSTPELVFEFMLNTTRLEQAIPIDLWKQKTGLEIQYLLPLLKIAQEKSLIELNQTHWQTTPLGRRYTNDLQALFLPD